MRQPFTHIQKTSCRLNWRLMVLLALWTITACAIAPQPPPGNATPLVTPLLLDGNRLFAEHRWTSAIMKYEETVQAQTTLAEAHDNLGMALYKKGPIAAGSPHFIEATD